MSTEIVHRRRARRTVYKVTEAEVSFVARVLMQYGLKAKLHGKQFTSVEVLVAAAYRAGFETAGGRVTEQ